MSQTITLNSPSENRKGYTPPQKIVDLLGEKPIWIAGAARSGLAAALTLRSWGMSVFVSDSGKIPAPIIAELKAANIEFEENGHSVEKFIREAALLVISPGIRRDVGLSLVALQQGIAVISEIEVASWALRDNCLCIGITGTNGKSTVTNYIAQLLSKQAIKALPCGNFGLPLCKAMSQKANAFVVELSSYQLESTFTFAPSYSVLLNLQNDHLARYQDLDTYLKAKWRLLCMTKQACLVGSDILLRALHLGLPMPQCQIILLNNSKHKHFDAFNSLLQADTPDMPLSFYGQLKTLEAHQILKDIVTDYASYTINDDQSLNITLSLTKSMQSPDFEVSQNIAHPCLPGEHNAKNILASSVIGILCGIPLSDIWKQWEKSTSTYTQLPHRLEQIGSDHAQFITSSGTLIQATLINDSKATNMESLKVALKSFQKPIRLLIGGDPKGEDFAPAADYFNHPVFKYYPFGKAGTSIAQVLNKVLPVGAVEPPFPSLFDAAQKALDEAQEGDILLLSPACASFDEFRDFEDRGDAFRAWCIEKLAKG